MCMQNYLKTIIPRILRKLDRPFKISIKRQKKYLASFRVPRDLIENSYFQYKCQKLFWGSVYYFFANLASCFLVPITHAKLKKLTQSNTTITPTELLLCGDEMPPNIFPETLFSEYFKNKNVSAFEGELWGKTEEQLYKEMLSRYKYSPFFIYKNMVKMAGYAYLIANHMPKAIAACGAEFTYTSSFLTEYCRRKGVKHYNTMHGEMFYYILDAFSVFDRFYVWDEHYIYLQKQLRADSNKYIVAVPPSVKVNFGKVNSSDLTYCDYKYYLQLQPRKKMLIIAKQIEKLKLNGFIVFVRLHPRTVNVEEVYDIFGKENVESPQKVSFEASLKSTDGVIAINSTVLFQAYVSGKKYVLDDVSEPKKTEKLKEMQYIMLTKKPMLLSILEKLKKEVK